ncbi:MAG: aminoacyl--tRNA ligase-related protein [Patescibacteria group bacterium]
MRQSALFTKTRKEAPANEESTNAKLLCRAGFAQKEMAGVYSFLPLGVRVLNKIGSIIREEMEAVGGQEVLLPALQAKENWVKTGRWESMDDLYKLKDRGNREFALGPTHEEILVPLMKQFVASYKDLPVAVYQLQNKFRDELRAKSGLLRGREFLMKDMYSFHADEEDMKNYYEVMKGAYRNVFSRLGLRARETEASGGTFSDFSHEYQVLTEAGEDTILYCECGFSQNMEIATGKHGDKCPRCKKGTFLEGKSIEVGNIFPLKDRFSQAFGLSYSDEKGKAHLVHMGCYGIGLGRAMGTIVEVHHDEKGIVWPASVAPFQAHLLSLPGAEKEGEKAYAALLGGGVEVLFDDRQDATPGEKFADADLLGIPLRVLVSEKTAKAKKVEVKARGEESSKLMEIDKIGTLL